MHHVHDAEKNIATSRFATIYNIFLNFFTNYLKYCDKIDYLYDVVKYQLICKLFLEISILHSYTCRIKNVANFP